MSPGCADSGRTRSQTHAAAAVSSATIPPTRMVQRAPKVCPIQPISGAPMGVPPMKIAM
jgi:hypothetical protein